jgi:hypothetical protein
MYYVYVIIYIKKFLEESCSFEGNLAPKLLAGICPRQKVSISLSKVMAGIIPETIKSATILVKDCKIPKILSAGTCPRQKLVLKMRIFWSKLCSAKILSAGTSPRQKLALKMQWAVSENLCHLSTIFVV